MNSFCILPLEKIKCIHWETRNDDLYFATLNALYDKFLKQTIIMHACIEWTLLDFSSILSSSSVSILIWKELFKKYIHAPISIALIDCINWQRVQEMVHCSQSTFPLCIKQKSWVIGSPEGLWPKGGGKPRNWSRKL